MPRKWKNSDEQSYFTDKANENRLEKLRCELINGYSRKKFNKKNNNNNGYKKNYNNNNRTK